MCMWDIWKIHGQPRTPRSCKAAEKFFRIRNNRSNKALVTRVNKGNSNVLQLMWRVMVMKSRIFFRGGFFCAETKVELAWSLAATLHVFALYWNYPIVGLPVLKVHLMLFFILWPMYVLTAHYISAGLLSKSYPFKLLYITCTYVHRLLSSETKFTRLQVRIRNEVL